MRPALIVLLAAIMLLMSAGLGCDDADEDEDQHDINDDDAIDDDDESPAMSVRGMSAWCLWRSSCAPTLTRTATASATWPG